MESSPWPAVSAAATAQVPVAATDASVARHRSRAEATERVEGSEPPGELNGLGGWVEDCFDGEVEDMAGGVDVALLPAFRFSMLDPG